MLEKPDLSDEKIIQSLHEGFDVTVNGIEFLPIGNDTNAWAYRVESDRQSYFLKVKKGLTNPRGITIPHYLNRHGLEQIVAPFSTKSGELWHPYGEFVLLLYPFIEGDNGMRTGLTEAQWIEYGMFLRTLHAVQLPAELTDQLPREKFIPTYKQLVHLEQVQTLVSKGKITGPIQAQLATFWREKEDVIAQIVRRTQELAQVLQPQSLKYVLCHADIHTANLLITPTQKMFVVDWDETILAPPERDLMFIIDSPIAIDPPVQPRQQTLFFQGYGNIDIYWPALAYYRYEWAVQDMGDFAARVFLMDGMGEITQQAALKAFMGLFSPGDEIDTAFKAEEKLQNHLF